MSLKTGTLEFISFRRVISVPDLAIAIFIIRFGANVQLSHCRFRHYRNGHTLICISWLACYSTKGRIYSFVTIISRVEADIEIQMYVVDGHKK